MYSPLLRPRLLPLALMVLASLITFLPSITPKGSASNRASIQQADKLDRLRELYRDLQAGAPFSDIEAEILRRFASGEEIADIEAELVISRAHYLKTVLRAELSQEQEEILRRYEQEIISQRILPQAPPSNDNCGGAVPLQLNIPVTSTTLDAVNDYQLSSSMACFSAGGAIGNAPNTATGRDVVYSFTAPDNDTYSFRVTSPGVSLNRTLFLSSSCPTSTFPLPVTVADAQCLGAANRRTTNDRAEEIYCVPLLAGQTVYLFIDDTFTSPTTGQPFTVEVTRCVSETEPNDSPALANSFVCGISGRIQNTTTDVDFFSLGVHPVNSRLFAIVDGGASNPDTGNPNYDLRVTTTVSTLEFDDNNNIIEFGEESPSIAGTPLPAGTPVYLRVSGNPSVVSSEPYRIYAVVRPPSSSATPEIEPNDSTGTANSNASNYFSGVIATTSDIDTFSFTATAGNVIFLSASADPDRNNTPFNIRLELLNSSGNVLLDAQDGEATSNTTPGTGSLTAKNPNFPGESILWRAQYTGTYYVRVRWSGGTVPNNYLLSIVNNGCGVPCTPFSLNPATLPNGTVGTPYSQNITTTGGTAPISYSVTSGTLPPGLTLTTSGSVGTLSGTPTAGGTYTFTITATDANGCAGTQTYTVSINCPTITLSPATLPNGAVGAAYPSQTLTASGGTAPYTFSVTSGTLPPGLTLSTGGVLSGTPTTAGTYNFTITATDANGCAGSQAYSVTIIVCPTITLSPLTLPNGGTGTPYSQTITASGGTAPYTFTLISGTLPPGLTLSTGGILSGTPTAPGNYTFTVRATDATGCTGSQTYTVTITCSTLTFSPPTLPGGTIGTPYSQTITASGGTAPYTFSVSAGTLPPGLTLSTGGVLSGTPGGPANTYTFTVTATDTNGCSGGQIYTITISCPTITLSPATLPNGSVGTPYSQTISAVGGTAPYTFGVTVGALPAGLTLNSATGVLSGTPTVPPGTYTFTVTATDANGCTGTQTYTVTISCPTITLSPGVLPNGVVGFAYSQTITAAGGATPYTFSVSAGALPPGLILTTSGPNTATISGSPTSVGTYTFTVTATDNNGCTGSQSYTVTITTCPTITLSPLTLPSGTVGTSYSQTITASGGVAPHTFSAAGTLPTGLTLSTGGVLSGTPTAAGSYTFTVTATDANGCTGSQTYTVTISCPTITLSPATLPNGFIGVSYSQTITASGGTAPYMFSVSAGTLPTGLTLNSGTGVISGTPTAAGTYTFTVTATDANGCSGGQIYTITISCPTITLSPATLPNGTIAVPYSQTITASGGTAPYTFGVTVGSIPPGLTLNSATGVLSGTPTATGSYTFTVTATDANGCTGSQTYTVAINCPTITLSPATLPNGTIAVPYSQTITASGGTAPYTFSVSAGTLPPGLTLNSGTGVISGTPTAAGSYTFTVTATDANSCTGSQTYTVAINCPTITLSPATLPNGTIAVPYSQTITASGGTAPYTFSVSAGTLPPGLTLNSGTGVISGTPTAAGSYTFTVTATDANGCTGSQTYTVAINCPTITLSPAALPNGFIGVPYSQTITASGGTAPYTFSVSIGTLPPGLTLNSGTGVISGTPTFVGSYSFIITATDANGCTGSQSYSVTIITCPTITLSPAALPNGSVGVPYSQTITASGGTAPHTFSVSAGTLPPGLTLNSGTGVLSGTPTTVGTYTFTVTATDTNGCTGSQAYSVTITACPTITLSPASLPAGTVGTAYSQTFTATGGTAPYTFSVSAGTLPPGLTLNSGTGVISGTPTTAGTYTFTVTATDTNGCTGSRNYTVTVTCPTINLTAISPTTGTVGTALTRVISASGGTSPYIFTLTGGTLPPGLTLSIINSTQAQISGTPTAAGTYNFTITATDNLGCSGSRNYTMTMNCPTITLTPAAGTLPAGTAGTPYSQTFTATGGTPPRTFSSTGTLPPGLTLNSATGVLSGTPTGPTATYNFTVTATDVYGCSSATQSYSLTIICATITVSPMTLPNGTTGVAYSQTITATGGSGTYTFSVSAGTLPTGLTLNSGTGVISGTPTVSGTFTFTITATDTNGCPGSQSYTVTINCPTISLSPTSLPAGTVGTPYSVTLTASGGTAPYTFVLTLGTLPPGLTLNSVTGVISGTPTTAGTFTFRVRATDANGCSRTRQYTITIN
ncbi:MAG: putative Ig domain-containing protein [Acidobacteriota bacterium]|nr:putative Ig domain-containing protein [Acidobacteriota bacterium]